MRALSRRLHQRRLVVKPLPERVGAGEPNRELIDDRVGELTLEHERLEQKLESLTHLLLSKEEREEIIAETARFVAALRSSLTDGPLDQRQGAIRRCVEQIVVNRNEGHCRVTLRRIPTIAGESLAAAIDERVVQFGATVDGSPRKR